MSDTIKPLVQTWNWRTNPSRLSLFSVPVPPRHHHGFQNVYEGFKILVPRWGLRRRHYFVHRTSYVVLKLNLPSRIFAAYFVVGSERQVETRRSVLTWAILVPCQAVLRL